jgi:glyoxylase-like metal-dependent hydrolase (beta-lactamase superfamily II)
VDFHEVAPGLRYWLAPHPEWRPGNDWPEEVLSAEYEAPDALVLIDPLVPRGEEDQFREHAQRLGLPLRVLLTAPWHRRDAGLFTGAQVDGDLPPGIEAFVADGVQEGQRALFIREHRTLVVAEYFIGAAAGLRICPSPAESDPDRFIQSLHRLLELPIERVLTAHGPPVLADGAGAIRRALEEAEGGR